jgi:hypothetical protein
MIIGCFFTNVCTVYVLGYDKSFTYKYEVNVTLTFDHKFN